MSGFDESPFLTHRPLTADRNPGSRPHTAISADGVVKTALGDGETTERGDQTVRGEDKTAAEGDKKNV